MSIDYMPITEFKWPQEILRNGFDKLDGVGVTHLDLAAHGTVSLSRQG